MALRFLSDIQATAGTKDSSGDLGSNGQVLSSTGSDTNWVNPTVGTTVIYKDSFTATDGQTVFTLANTVDSEDKTQVYIDGAYQSKGGYTVSGTTLTFDTGLAEYSEVEVMTFSTATANNAASAVKLDTFTGDGSDLTFVLSEAVVDEKVTQVYINGVYQNKSTYSIDSDLVTLRFGTGNAPPNSSAIEVISFKTITSTDGTLTATTFFGDLNGTINTATTATTQSAGNNSTLVATTEFATTALNLKSNIASPTFTGTVGGITKAMVGLSNVDNTTDANKPVSTAGQAALDLKANIAGPTFTGDTGAANLTLSGYLRGPASFVIDPAAHGDDTGTVVIAGNLQVDGTTTTINSTTVSIDDLNFSIATDAADSAAANGAGITIGGAGASLTYSHSGTKFVLNKPLDVTGAGTFSGALSGTSATFSGLLEVTNSYVNFTRGGQLLQLNPNYGNANIYAQIDSALPLRLAVGGVDALTIASTGAATFSHSDTGSTTDYATKIIKASTSLIGGYTGTKIISALGGYDGTIHAVDFGFGYNTTGYDLVLSTNDNTVGNPIERMRITSGGAATFSGSVTVNSTAGSINLIQSSAGAATYYVMQNTVETGGKKYRFGYTGASLDKGSFSIYNETDDITPFLIASTGAATFASTISLAEMATIIVSDISTGENRGLKLENTGGGGKTWNITPGLTGSDNATFTIRNATDNVNALTIASGGAATFSGAITSGDITTNGNNKGLYFNGTRNAILGNASTEEVSIATANVTRLTIASTGAATFTSNGSNAHQHVIINQASSPYSIWMNHTTVTNNNSYDFIRCAEAGSTNRFYLWTNGGIGNYQSNDSNLSDERVKKEISLIPSYWDKFKALEIVKFKYKDQTTENFNIGIIAQQVESVAPEFINNEGWGELEEGEEPLKSVYTADLYHATIKVLQEAMTKIESQQTTIEDLKARIEILEG
jgi:hypothetical protein